MSKKDFCVNDMAYDACILNFINIGKQVKELSKSFRDKYSEIPYRKIIGLRNITAHSYEGLETFRLYMVIAEDLPLLDRQFTKIIDSGGLV